MWSQIFTNLNILGCLSRSKTSRYFYCIRYRKDGGEGLKKAIGPLLSGRGLKGGVVGFKNAKNPENISKIIMVFSPLGRRTFSSNCSDRKSNLCLSIWQGQRRARGRARIYINSVNSRAVSPWRPINTSILLHFVPTLSHIIGF